MRRPATIRQVAERARVSVATVSRVINRSAHVSPAAADSVRAAMRELGFRPNVIGRQLKTAASRTIGVMIPSLANPVFADTLQGIEDAARKVGYSLVVASTDYQAASEEAIVESLLSHRVEGLLLTVADAGSSGLLDLLDAEGVPYVLLFNQPEGEGRPAVTVDNRRAIADMVRHLIGLGHRRLAMVAGAFHASDRSRQRFDGFNLALDAAGLPNRTLVEISFEVAPLTSRLAGLFAATDAPSALVCSNDMLAIAAIRSLRDLGLRVPEDVSVVGFDGIAVGALMVPRLTTIDQPRRDIGARGFSLLMDSIAGAAVSHTVLLPYRLCPGESAAAPCPSGVRRGGLCEPQGELPCV
ncbi:MAG: LacI family DNA-binding transcriptional regulator [Rhodospirillales bacterium]|nr:MAG: LacI family DNA-binding transcriptional regulator [Rhodospirillales bacterium]